MCFPAKNSVRGAIIAVSKRELMICQSHENFALGSAFRVAIMPPEPCCFASRESRHAPPDWSAPTWPQATTLDWRRLGLTEVVSDSGQSLAAARRDLEQLGNYCSIVKCFCVRNIAIVKTEPAIELRTKKK
jgi:hypothetical protein